MNEIPIVLFPVVGGDWTQDDACTLLSDLTGQMQSRNQWCMAEVMAHVGTQGVTDVREVEDVLLAHIGLASSRMYQTLPPGGGGGGLWRLLPQSGRAFG